MSPGSSNPLKPATVRAAPRHAGLWIRGAALVIDGLLFCALFFPLTYLLKGVWLMAPADHRWASGWFVSDPLCLGFLVLIFAYFTLLEGLRGATLGKWLLGLRVIGVDGGTPGLGRGLVRNLLRLVDGLPALSILGVLLIVTSDQGARFGDRIAGTRVLRGTL